MDEGPPHQGGRMLEVAFWLLFGAVSVLSAASGRDGRPRRLSPRRDSIASPFDPPGATWTWMPDSNRDRALCLALAVVGPLTLSRALGWIPRGGREGGGGDAEGQEAVPTPRTRRAAACALGAVGARAQAIFSTVEWGTIKGLLSFLGGVDQCLEWLGAGVELPPEEVPYLRAGIEMLQRLDAEHSALAADVERLREELAASRARCDELSRLNAAMRGGAASSVERIIEQDQEQISALLADKARLQEENGAMAREVAALQDLLQYAEERQRMAETPGPEGEEGPEEGLIEGEPDRGEE